MVETADQNSNELAKYAQGEGIDEPLAESAGGATSYFEQDGLGSITSLTSTAGALANTYTYDSFGNVTASTGTVSNPFQFTGREFDPETGLYYYRARYYDPTTGRFLSEDPLGLGADSINFYEYAYDDPLGYVDPLGLSSLLFSRLGNTLTLYDKNGHPVLTCLANNKTIRHSRGPWPNGTFPYLEHKYHPPDPNGPFGLNGIFLFKVPGRSGMGLHAGRANKGGPNVPTKGCVRTTNECMQDISKFVSSDPLQTITIAP